MTANATEDVLSTTALQEEEWTVSSYTASFESDSLPAEPPAYKLAVMWLVDIMIIIFNIPVFIITPRSKSIPDATRVAMVMLAISDVWLSVQRITRWTIFAIRGSYNMEDTSWFCLIDSVIAGVALSVSVVTLMYICVDRFVQIKFPFMYARYLTKRNLLLLQFSIVLFYIISISAVTQIHPLYFNTVVYDCRWHFTGVVGILVAVNLYFSPGSIIFFCCLGIYFLSRAQVQNITSQNNAIESNPQISVNKQTMKVIRTLTFMTIGYYTCWIPFIVCVVFLQDMFAQTISHSLEFFCVWLAYSNSAINPFIYISSIKEYRVKLLRIFCNVRQTGP